MKIFPRTPVPDLLKRFVITRFKLLAKGYSIETNDADLLEPFCDHPPEIPSGFRLRLIREEEITESAASQRMLCNGVVCTLVVGDTILLVDREQKAIFAFVSPQTSPETFARVYLPKALQHAHAYDAEWSPAPQPTVPRMLEPI